ncbi:MAG: tRNA pseudouridine(55) synthase TruB [Cyclobacteriaceae bacterium]|nr:tRNA pseudouridine(55) synthase TruB [Cyclobacteriaceae bacterium]
MKENPYLDKVLLVNKPVGWTSFDVVNKLRKTLHIKKIGHSGTLDPLATGLLVICTGKMTKKIPELTGLDKEYTGALLLGQSSPSHDRETEVNEVRDISGITPDKILNAASLFVGSIEQIPPAHSAVKVEGKRAYQLARKGELPELKPRTVVIHAFEITGINLPEVRFRVACSKGTYIRSLVRDLGEKLGTGAILTELCRTRIGNYHLADAQSIESFT